jgi:hypothetical protein
VIWVRLGIWIDEIKRRFGGGICLFLALTSPSWLLDLYHADLAVILMITRRRVGICTIGKELPGCGHSPYNLLGPAVVSLPAEGAVAVVKAGPLILIAVSGGLY